MSTVVERPKPPRGEQTIEITLRFQTDGIADEAGHIRVGWCWDEGHVIVPVQPAHGVEKSTEHMHFHGLAELEPAVLKALHRAGLSVLHTPSGRRTTH